MRIKRDYSHLPIEEQIKKINFRIKFLYIFCSIFSPVIIVASILIGVFLSEWGFAIALMIAWPISIFLGGYLQVKGYKDEIKRLREKGEQDKQNSTV